MRKNYTVLLTTVLVLSFITVMVRSAECRQPVSTVSTPQRGADCPEERTYKGNVNIETEADWKNLDLYCAIDGYLTVKNSSVKEMKNSSLRRISQSLFIKRNDLLGEVFMKNLKSVKGILVWKNEQLREIHFPALENVDDLLYISKNPLLVVQDLKRSPSDDTRVATLEEKSARNWFAVSLDKVSHLGGWLVIEENGTGNRAPISTQNEVAISDPAAVSP